MSSSMKLGGGGKFATFVKKNESKGESAHEAKAVAAIAGRKKYGKAKMVKMAVAGRKRRLKSGK